MSDNLNSNNKEGFDQYLRLVNLAMKEKKYRSGQAYFNVLDNVRRDIADYVAGHSEFDPYYDDKNIPAFMVYVYQNW